MKAVIAESFERIHRSNLVGMGVLPLQFMPGENANSLGISGKETFTIEGLGDKLSPGCEVEVRMHGENKKTTQFKAHVRLNTPIEVEYYRNGGVLNTVLKNML